MHGQNWWQNQFHRRGARMTRPRELVIGILSDKSGHLSASDIYIEAHKINPGVGLTTVYRTLEMLADMGVVNRFDFGDGKARYELNSGEDNSRRHSHFVCVRCRRVIDFRDSIKPEDNELLNRVSLELEKKFSFKIQEQSLRLSGICSECAGKE